MRIIKRLTRKLLARLGLPLHFWPYVIRAAAEIYNKTVQPDGTSPWAREYGAEPDREVIPGDAIVFSDPADDNAVKVGAYMGLRTHSAAYVLRSVPEDWDSVELFVLNPKRLRPVKIRSFENGLTYDTLMERPTASMVEFKDLPPANKLERVSLRLLAVPDG